MNVNADTWSSPAALARRARGECAPRIPRVFYTYWDDEDSMPYVCKACMRQWGAWNPDARIVVLTQKNIHEYLLPDDVALALSEPHPAYRSDVIRACVLSERGGVWLDASILMGARLTLPDASFCGYYIARCNRPNAHGLVPVVENWFFACTPHDAFATAWAAEIRAVQRVGHAQYIRDAEARRGVNCQGLNARSMLSMHVAAQAILQGRTVGEWPPTAPPPPPTTRDTFQLDARGSWDMCLLKAEAGPFAHYQAARWKATRAMSLLHGYVRYPLVKLTRSQRPALECRPDKEELCTAFLPSESEGGV